MGTVDVCDIDRVTSQPALGGPEPGLDTWQTHGHSLLHGHELVRRTNNTASDAAQLRVSTDGPGVWGGFWAQLHCPPKLRELPASTGGGNATLQREKKARASAWALLAGAGEGIGARLLHVPVSTQPVWRPLALVRGDYVGLQASHEDCSIQYVYKGSHHPLTAPRCSMPAEEEYGVGTGTTAASRVAGESMSRLPLLQQAPASEWYPPPRGPFHAPVLRWLASFMFISPGHMDVFALSDAPERPYGSRAPDGSRGGASGPTASECLFSRCGAEFVACYEDVACRDAFDHNPGWKFPFFSVLNRSSMEGTTRLSTQTTRDGMTLGMATSLLQ